jgi:hypothetical protein
MLVADNAKRRKRIWVLNVDVDANELDTRLAAMRAKGLDASQEKIADGVRLHIERARAAANREDPRPGRWLNWWRGALVEAAYRNLHAARTQMVDLYDANELQAEVPVAVARAQAELHRDDPRLVTIEALSAEPVRRLRPRLRRLMENSYEELDSKHAQLRSFRNILLMSAAIITLLVVVTIVVVALNPKVMPFCFPHEIVTDSEPVVTTEEMGLNCPTRSETEEPTGGDVLVVALLGALGGALAASVSIRNLKGTSSAYDVPVALAFLKVPLGAFTSILALVAIQGEFVPGLSNLDSQEQILAYALVFGFAQQLLTRLLDQRAQTLLEGLPGGTEVEPKPTPPKPSPPEPVEKEVPAETDAVAAPPADLPEEDVEVESSEEPTEVEPVDDLDVAAAVVAEDEVALPDPLTDQGDELQDDEVPPEE